MTRQSILLLFSFVFLTSVWGGSYFSTTSDGEGIFVNRGKIQCGTLACPPEATGCILRKKNNQFNPKIIDVLRRCVADNGTTIIEKEEHFEARNGEVFDTYINTGTYGSSNIVINNNLDPKKQAEIENEVKKLTVNINHQIQHTVGQTMRDLDKQLKGLGDLFRNRYW